MVFQYQNIFDITVTGLSTEISSENPERKRLVPPYGATTASACQLDEDEPGDPGAFLGLCLVLEVESRADGSITASAIIDSIREWRAKQSAPYNQNETDQNKLSSLPDLPELPQRLLLKATTKNSDLCSSINSSPEIWPALTVDAGLYLLSLGLALVGLDSPALDESARTNKRSIEHLFAKSSLPWLVNLDLSEIDCREPYFLVCTPAIVSGEEKSPVAARALLLSLPEVDTLMT